MLEYHITKESTYEDLKNWISENNITYAYVESEPPNYHRYGMLGVIYISPAGPDSGEFIGVDSLTISKVVATPERWYNSSNYIDPNIKKIVGYTTKHFLVSEVEKEFGIDVHYWLGYGISDVLDEYDITSLAQYYANEAEELLEAHQRSDSYQMEAISNGLLSLLHME
jgi:hypothetical protein